MEELTITNEAEEHQSVGTWLGRRQAYSLIAGTCSAADAKCLHELRETRAHKRAGLTWEEFCKQRIGMCRSAVDQIIRQWKEFGPTYFALHQITGITADDFRAIRGSIEDGSLRYRDGAIPIQAEQAPKLLEAVRELAPPPPPRSRKPALSQEDGVARYQLAEDALKKAHVHIKGMQEYRYAPEYRHRLEDLIQTLSMEMLLLKHLT